jgi:isopenicillin N synthase-like dioxygenase
VNQVPVIDLAPLLDGTSAGRRAVAREIGAAARDIGFFAVANHGIPATLVSDVFAAAATFFALPQTVKARVAIEQSPQYLGFARLESESLDPTRPGDRKESFNMGREIAADDPAFLAGQPFVGLNQWPELPGFRPTLVAYYAALLDLGIKLHQAIAIDLGIDPQFFAGAFTQPLSALRLLHYPPHPGAFAGGQYGAGPHTDYGNITLLAQDQTGGLEVRTRSGEWIAVEPTPGTFVCNIGDALMRWSNDVYVSNPHRVINRSPNDRYSVVFFCEPNADTRIECLPACSGAENPPKYAPIAFADYLRSRLEPTYARATAQTQA